MTQHIVLMLASAAGFIGGMVSHYPLPATAHVQIRAIPQQIRAHEFVVADESGTALEVIGIEKDGKPSMEFLNHNGRVRTVRFNGGLDSIYAGYGPKNPTLLPIKP